ncbi:MAG: hypothetical protein ACYCV0_10650 [Desulfitobacteriaceae bacterium]
MKSIGKPCILEERLCIECEECDRCELDPHKICDNCCKCLEEPKADYVGIIVGIIIEDILLNSDEQVKSNKPSNNYHIKKRS